MLDLKEENKKGKEKRVMTKYSMDNLYLLPLAFVTVIQYHGGSLISHSQQMD